MPRPLLMTITAAVAIGIFAWVGPFRVDGARDGGDVGPARPPGATDAADAAEHADGDALELVAPDTEEVERNTVSDSAGESADPAANAGAAGPPHPEESSRPVDPPTPITVRMVFDGEPVPWGHVQTTRGDRAWRTAATAETWSLTGLGETGTAELARPDGPFAVDAMAPGFIRATHGPFDPAVVGDELVIPLARGHALHGRVVAAGKAVPGARIALTRSGNAPGEVRYARTVARPDAPFDVVTHRLLGDHDATSDAEGAFTAALPFDGLYTVAIDAPGFGVTTFGPFDWRREEGASRSFALDPPGSLSGVVIQPVDGGEPVTHVAASNGDGVARVVAVDPDGAYRFEGLAPGGWQVRESTVQEAGEHALKSAGDCTAREPRWDVFVPVDGDAHFQLDLRHRGSVVLEGTFHQDGAAWERAWVRVHPAEWRGHHDGAVLAETRVQADGSFALRTSCRGPVILAIAHGRLSLRKPLELHAGTNRWDVSIQTGGVRITGSPPRTSTREVVRRAYLRSQLADGTLAFYLAWIQPLEDRKPVTVSGVPAGETKLVHDPGHAPFWEHGSDDGSWVQLGTVHVPPGGVGTLALP